MENIPKEFFIHKKGKELDKFLEIIFNHYRREGFPYFPTNMAWRKDKFMTLMNSDDNIIRSNIIGRNNSGVSLAWSYFPHGFSVRCGKMKSPMDAFMDDDLFRKCLRGVVRLGNDMNDQTIRRDGLSLTGVQAVSNFRPTAASAIYRTYAGENSVIWDMSGGWGGRMLGAIKANAKFYIATEPSTLTHKGLIELGNDFFPKKQFEIHKLGSEVYRPDKNSLDICFTSPPYFNVEKYSDEPTQSFKKFDNREAWLEGFMLKTLENCYHGLKKGKYCLINIADPKHEKGLSIEREMPKLAKRVGFTFTGLLNLELASMPSKANVGRRFRAEPVFIFKK